MRYEGLMGMDMGWAGAIAGAIATVAVVQPAALAATAIADVNVRTVGDGIEVELVVAGGDRPQVFLLPPQGNSLIAHIADSTLTVPGGQFSQTSPAPGIASVEAIQLQPGTVQVTVRGAGSRPIGRVRTTTGSNILLSYSAAAPQAVSQTTGANGANSAASGGTAIAQSIPSTQPLVPNPSITIDGQPATLGQVTAPPVLPRAVAPPVGDIAVSEVPIQPLTVQLASNPVIPRLVLREAPAREVLSLLARTAGMNIVYVDDPTAGASGGTAPAAGGTGATASVADIPISVDIEGELAQDVFNTVLRTTGLQANRQGRTIFVGRALPNSAREVVMRSIRLNQTTADRAAGFLVTLGAESASTAVERKIEVVQLQSGGQAGGQTGSQGGTIQAAPLTQTTTTERTTINPLRYDPKDSPAILRGLQVAVESRTNTLTLVGQSNLVALASEQLMRIDGRVRQVVVNVRVIDINLSNEDRLGTSFSFGIDGTRIVNTGGVGLINWTDKGAPYAIPSTISTDTIGDRPIQLSDPANANANSFNIGGNFLAQLQASVVAGNSKILTDPTLVVQEGQLATVNLTEEVVGKIESQSTQNSNTTVTTTTLTKDKAGLLMDVKVDRIDDNGFVTISISPSLKVPVGQFDNGDSNGRLFATLLAERKLSTGTIRIRDGQTLVLAGIIQDTDRTTVSKIPILGDLPLIGSLFRRTDRNNERKELVVLITPQVLDDSTPSTVGYSYTPSREAQEAIQRSNFR